MKVKLKKYLLLMFTLMLALIFSASWATADANTIWLIKTKSEPIYTLWVDGTITFGEPDAIIETINIAPTQFNFATSPRHWFIRGNAIYTPWQRKPLCYSFESKTGSTRVGLSAKNFGGGSGWTKPTGYSHFKVDVYVDNLRKGRLRIKASDTEVNTEYLNIEQLDKGHHDIKFIWVNDKYAPGRKQDANIEIHDVLIEQAY